MSLPECECDGPGHCPRYGRRVNLRDVEVCSGRCPAERPCADKLRERHVARLSGQALPAEPAGPGLLAKAANAAGALARSAAAGFALAPPGVAQARGAICDQDSCGYRNFEKDICAHPKCGCPLSRVLTLGLISRPSKLEVATESCPAGLWGESLGTAEAPWLEAIEGDHAGWPAGWEHLPETARAYRLRFAHVCREALDASLDGAGRGVVTCAGGWRFVGGVYVLARVLRHLGSTLPVECWYMGPREFDPCFAALTAGLGVSWIDAQAHAAARGIPVRRWGGWECKSYAVQHSAFAEVLFLDADCYPERDPEYLFDCAEYRARGAVFWPDIGSVPNGAPLAAGQWARWGIPARRTSGLESGQLLVDRRRCGPQLAACRWLNDHSDYTYRHLYGDKDTWAVAWHGIGQARGTLRHGETPYALAPPAGWHNVAFRQHDPAGRPLFVHRCRDKPRIRFEPAPPGESRGPYGYATPQREGRMVVDATLPLEEVVHTAVAECDGLLRPDGLHWRPGTADEDIWREVRLLNVYRLPERFGPSAVVVDVGAHAGFFALECIRRGAAAVCAYEPYPASHALAVANLAGYPQARLSDRAVWSHAATLGMSPGRPGYTGEPSAREGPAEVRAEAAHVDDVLREAAALSGTGRVALLKLDCEGAEWPILAAATTLGLVDAVAGEYHPGPEWAGPEWLRGRLEEAGFEAEVIANPLAPGVGLFFGRRPA